MKRGRAACLLGCLLVAATAAASPRMEVEPAFDAWRAGDLLALRVSVVNDGPAERFRLSARTVDTTLRPRVVESLELAAGARKSLWIAVQPSGELIEVLLSQGGQELDRHELFVDEKPWSQPLVVALAPPPAGLAKMLQAGHGRTPRAGLVESSVEGLPEDPQLWPSIDQIVWPAPLSHELSPRQAEALRRWVVDGGHLIAGTNPEDPTALVTLGLAPETSSPDGQALGWGRVQRVPETLARADAFTWRALLDLRDEPPSARTHGPSLLALRAQTQVEAAIEPPFLAGCLVLAGTLTALTALPWLRARKVRRGDALARRRWPVSLAVIGAASLLSLSIAHFGAGRGLVVDRLDIVDVDAETGRTRERSVFALRRARSGPLELDTRGAGRLCVIDGGIRTDDDSYRADHVLSGDAASTTAGVLSWETVRLRARWRSGSVALPDLSQTPERLGRELRAVRAAIKRGQSLQWLPDATGESDLAWAARLLRAQRKGLWPTQLRGVPELMEAAFFSTDGSEQWGWPSDQRWARRDDEAVLIALATGSSTPPLLIDGREVEGEAWTLWRVRLSSPGGAGP